MIGAAIALFALTAAYLLIFNPDIGQLARDLLETSPQREARRVAYDEMISNHLAYIEAENAKERAKDEAEYAAYCAAMEAR